MTCRARAVDLGIPPDRIETIISFEKAVRYGIKNAGSADGSTLEVLAEMASHAASGRIEIPIAATYPLHRVRDAFATLEQRHTHGRSRSSRSRRHGLAGRRRA